MIKLYRTEADGTQRYWETWDNGDGSATVHFGELGTHGESFVVRRRLLKSADAQVARLAHERLEEGYVDGDDVPHAVLVVEYVTTGEATDLDKRHALEARLKETLGWTGLGDCDGGSIGSGTMEVFCDVVDYELARAVVDDDLRGTDFGDFSRIYRTDA